MHAGHQVVRWFKACLPGRRQLPHLPQLPRTFPTHTQRVDACRTWLMPTRSSSRRISGDSRVLRGEEAGEGGGLRLLRWRRGAGCAVQGQTVSSAFLLQTLSSARHPAHPAVPLRRT